MVLYRGAGISDAVVFRYDGGRRLATLLASIASPVFSLVSDTGCASEHVRWTFVDCINHATSLLLGSCIVGSLALWLLRGVAKTSGD